MKKTNNYKLIILRIFLISVFITSLLMVIEYYIGSICMIASLISSILIVYCIVPLVKILTPKNKK